MGIFDTLRSAVSEAEKKARQTVESVSHQVQQTGQTTAQAITQEAGNVAHQIQQTGQAAARAVSLEGQDVASLGQHVWSGFQNTLSQAEQLCEILKHISFADTGHVKPGNAAAMRSQLEAAKSSRRKTSNLAHAERASAVMVEAAQLTGTTDKIQAGSQVAKANNWLMAIGVSVAVGVGLGVAGGTGFWWEPNGTWGGYWSGSFNFGLPLGVGDEIVYTYILPEYGLAHFQGYSEAITIAGGEGLIGSISALFANSNASSFMGFSVGGGAGYGSPVEVYRSIGGTLAQARLS